MTEAETRLTTLIAETNEVTGESDASVTECLKTFKDRYPTGRFSSIVNYAWLAFAEPHSGYVLRSTCKMIHTYNASGTTHGYLSTIYETFAIPHFGYSAKLYLYRKFITDDEVAKTTTEWAADYEANPSAWTPIGGTPIADKYSPVVHYSYKLMIGSSSANRTKGQVYLLKVTPYNCTLFDTFYKSVATIAPVEPT